jgi:hypothetical protein
MRTDYVNLAAAARCGDTDAVDCIALDRTDDGETLRSWLLLARLRLYDSRGCRACC